MLRSKASAVFFRSDALKRYVFPKHGKDGVADLMCDSAHCYRLFLAGTLPGVVVVNYRIHRYAAPFINLYVIERGYVKNSSGKDGARLDIWILSPLNFPDCLTAGSSPK